jgi:YHS domain-containing protein
MTKDINNTQSISKFDPVCGMEIKDTSNTEKCEYNGKTYYFCTTLCKIMFELEPEEYLNKNKREQ